MKNYLLIACVSVLVFSCQKPGVFTPEFTVQADKTSYKAGESVSFTLNGNADFISFFSGEPLSDYAFKNERIIQPDFINVSFTTGVAYGNHPDMLSVWISNDFNGDYTPEGINAATWSNAITKDFVIAPNSMNSTSVAQAVPAGTIDIKAAAVDKTKPIYLGFKLRKFPDSDPKGGTQRNWFVRSLKIETGTLLGSELFSDMRNLKLVYDSKLNTPALQTSSLSSTSMTIRVPSSLPDDTLVNWAISPPLSANEFDNGPDRPVPIRGYRDETIKTYEYVYYTPGTYNVVFVARNSNIYGSTEEIVRTIPITITE